jgi:predicted phage terminase large subunit-like protein
MAYSSTLPPSLRRIANWPRADLQEYAARHASTSARQPFAPWLKSITPDWQWDWLHLQFIREQLARVTAGEINKLMLFVPPRHGKSEMVTVRYSAWRLERNPGQRVIIGAYNQTLANKFSRKVRRIAIERNLPIDRKRTASEEWETLAGGGLRAVGVGAGVTGMGGDLIVIDDPVKNRAEANSSTYRDKVWSWYTDDLYTRLEPGGQMVLIMTRWHEDDLAGRILESEDGPNWTVVSLPALAEGNDPLGRPSGTALCPDRYDVDALGKIKTAIGSRAFASLYQQRPVEQEGGMFRRSYFAAVQQSPEIDAMVRYWDMAATAGDGDYTAGVLMGRGSDGRYYVLDVVHGQWSTNERDERIKAAAKGDGAAVVQWIEEEPGSSGKDRTAYLIRNLAGIPIRAERVTGDKQTRAEPFAAQCEAGNVSIVRASWNGAFIDELCMFPNGAHDDMVDAASGAFGKIAQMGPVLLW